MYTGSLYIALFFVYGLAFFTMGIAAFLQKSDKNSNFPLLKAIGYLGLFGIIHGLTEWNIMVRIANMFPQYHTSLVVLGTFKNSLSFVFLWIFGAKLLQTKGKVRLILKGLPWLIFTVWLTTFTIHYFRYGTTSLHWILIEDIMSRYFLGFPAGLICAYGLYRNAKEVENLKISKTARKLKGMAAAFGLYGILAGVVVKNRTIFPANIINRESFLNVFGFPVELGRAILAITIMFLFLGVIKIFQWETNKKIDRLMKHQIINEERKKMGQELHDVIIQNLFATGLQVENVMEMQSEPKVTKELEVVKDNLNETIMEVREFIKVVSDSRNQIEDLKLEITTLMNNFRKNSNIPINLKYTANEATLGLLSQDKITQIYYIIQEALCNAIKHAAATEINIDIKTTIDAVTAKVEDNGKGFNKDRKMEGSHYGMISMKERALKINGILDIVSNNKGTSVSITIPWEE